MKKVVLIALLAFSGLLMADQAENKVVCDGLKKSLPGMYAVGMDYFSIMDGKESICAEHSQEDWEKAMRSEYLGPLLGVSYEHESIYKKVIDEVKKTSTKDINGLEKIINNATHAESKAFCENLEASLPVTARAGIDTFTIIDGHTSRCEDHTREEWVNMIQNEPTFSLLSAVYTMFQSTHLTSKQLSSEEKKQSAHQCAMSRYNLIVAQATTDKVKTLEEMNLTVQKTSLMQTKECDIWRDLDK